MLLVGSFSFAPMIIILISTITFKQGLTYFLSESAHSFSLACGANRRSISGKYTDLKRRYHLEFLNIFPGINLKAIVGKMILCS
jgi:hypothetical protein